MVFSSWLVSLHGVARKPGTGTYFCRLIGTLSQPSAINDILMLDNNKPYVDIDLYMAKQREDRRQKVSAQLRALLAILTYN